MGIRIPDDLSTDLDPGVRRQIPILLPHAYTELARHAVPEQPSVQHDRAVQAAGAQHVPTRGTLDPAEVLPGPAELLRVHGVLPWLGPGAGVASETLNAAHP